MGATSTHSAVRPPAGGYDAFVSHSSLDAAVAAALVAGLEKRGVRCFITPRDIVPGKEWSEALIDGLRQSKTMVLVLSEHSNTSKQVLREVERAAHLGLSIVPFRIEDIVPSKALEYFISAHHWMNAYDTTLDEQQDTLAETVQALLAKKDGPVEELGLSGEFKAIPRTSRQLVGRWLKKRAAILFLLVSFLALGAAGYFAFEARPNQSVEWTEAVRAEDWMKWRRQIHDKLTAGPITEKALKEVLALSRPGRPSQSQHAAWLRRDEAIADALLTYPRVREILKLRFGVDDNFRYAAASIHEFLIPNLADNDARVFMRRFDSGSEMMEKTIQELVEAGEGPGVMGMPGGRGLAGEGSGMGPGAGLGGGKQRGQIAERLAHKDRDLQPLVRFALIPEPDKNYSNRLGRKDALRVFACSLSEVWTMKARDAADQSGCPWKSGATFFIWVFLPSSKDEVVPATWGDLMRSAPVWLGELETKAP